MGGVGLRLGLLFLMGIGDFDREREIDRDLEYEKVQYI